MVRVLFEDFLETEQGYRACEAYWMQLIQAIAESLGQAGEWVGWLSRAHFEQVPPTDGEANPITSRRSRNLNRAFRVIQYPVEDDKLLIGGYVTSDPENEDYDLPRDEMVIQLSLSEESAEAARRLLAKWMIPETTPAEMKTFMDTMFDELGIEYDS